MALTKQDKAEIQELFNIAVKEGQNKDRDKYKQTEKRLYAYPILKKNIKRYKLDMEDIKHEDIGRSKDIVLYTTAGGAQLELEELRAAKIFVIQQKKARDEKEVAEIDAILQEVNSDEYFKIIPMKYIQRMSNEEIAERLHCEVRTVGRHKSRLIKEISIGLYGADAL